MTTITNPITIRMVGAGKVFGLKGNIGSYTEEDISAFGHTLVKWINDPSNAGSKKTAIEKHKNGFLKIGNMRVQLSITEDDALMHDEVVRRLTQLRDILKPSEYTIGRIAG